MYKFVDIDNIVKGKIINRINNIANTGIKITMSKQALANITDDVLSTYYNSKNQTLNRLDDIVNEKLNVELFEYTIK